MKYLLLFLLLLPLTANATDYKILELDSLYVDYKNFAQSTRDPLFYASTKKESLSLNMNTNLIDFIYLDSRVHGETNYAKYELVGLEIRLGARITRSLEVGYQHHSQHLLDDRYPYMGFPVEDSFNVRLYLYGNSKRGALLD